METQSEGRTRITVRNALDLSSVRAGVPEVLAGDAGLDAEIQWVHAGEVANMATMLSGGELLLTTGMGLTGGAISQRRFIAALAERGVAGLVIELGTTFGRLPNTLVAEAERRGLPLIVFHREVPFVEITKAVHEELIGGQLRMIRRADEFSQHFSELLLDGAGIPEVLDDLAASVDNPVFLVGAERGVLHHACGGLEEAEVLIGWEAAETGLEKAPRMIATPLRGCENRGISLVALEMREAVDPIGRIALERAAHAIAFAFTFGEAEGRLEERARSDFFVALLEQGLHESEIAERAARRGFCPKAGERLLPLVLVRSRRRRSASSKAADWRRIWRLVDKELTTKGISILAGTQAEDQGMIFLLAMPARSERERAAELLARIIGSAADHVLGAEDAVVLCAGAAVANWTAAREELERTLEAASSAAATSSAVWCDVTVPDVNRLLWALSGHDSLQRFVDDRLSAILEHDSNRRSELLETLEAYCEHGGRKTETARALHLQRQSLYHRLNRIEQLIGGSLSDQDDRFGLHLALRARRFMLEHQSAPAQHSLAF